jgi:hypothetical protein
MAGVQARACVELSQVPYPLLSAKKFDMFEAHLDLNQPDPDFIISNLTANILKYFGIPNYYFKGKMH